MSESDCKQNHDEGQGYQALSAVEGLLVTFVMNLRSGTIVGAHLLNPQHRPAFEEGIRQIFMRWTALCLAVEQEWGGRSSTEKANSLQGEILEWFYSRKEHYADDLEALLNEAMLDDFNVEAEDGSPMQVAQSLVSIYNECFQGNYSTVQRMQAQAAAGASRSQRARVPGEQGDGEDSSSDEEDGEGEDEDEEMEDVQAAPPQPPQPIVDEDGFTLVQRSRGRGR